MRKPRLFCRKGLPTQIVLERLSPSQEDDRKQIEGMNDFYDVGAFEGSTNELLQLNLRGEQAIFIFIDLK